MARVAALVSGGMDSIYAAYDRAMRTDDPITIVHFELGEVWGPTSDDFVASQLWAAEAAARWISANVRPVELLVVPVSRFHASGWWATELIFWAAERCSAGRYDDVITGWCGENFSPHRAVLLRRLQRAIFARYASRGTLAYPLERITKVDIMRAMPAALQSISMSCHEPRIDGRRAYACGACRKCVRNDYLRQMLASDLPLEEVKRRHLEKIAATPHHGGKGYREVYSGFELWALADEPAAQAAAAAAAPAH
jgi:7-cyano-7-deazaguanine synthase in queuosine biosynthesis